jgi:hypothetical protein
MEASRCWSGQTNLVFVHRTFFKFYLQIKFLQKAPNDEFVTGVPASTAWLAMLFSHSK